MGFQGRKRIEQSAIGNDLADAKHMDRHFKRLVGGALRMGHSLYA